MKRIWEIFPDVASRVRSTHESVKLVGHHDWVHTFRVGEIAYQIALDEWDDERLAELAGLAGLFHNADRVLTQEGGNPQKSISQDTMVKLITLWRGDTLNPMEVGQVLGAVVGHDRINAADDSQVLITLMDADRVVNLDSDLFIRSGQHYSHLPPVDYRHFLDDPDATYQSPGSVLRDCAYSLDWVDPSSPVCVRTGLGRALANQRAEVFKTFFAALKVQLDQEGILPFPFQN